MCTIKKVGLSFGFKLLKKLVLDLFMDGLKLFEGRFWDGFLV